MPGVRGVGPWWAHSLGGTDGLFRPDDSWGTRAMGDRGPWSTGAHKILPEVRSRRPYLRGDADALAWLKGRGPRSVIEAADRWQLSAN
jgi:hypothetical protein